MEELDELRKRLRKNPIVRATFNVHLPADTRDEADRRADVQARLRARGLDLRAGDAQQLPGADGPCPGRRPGRSSTRAAGAYRRWRRRASRR